MFGLAYHNDPNPQDAYEAGYRSGLEAGRNQVKEPCEFCKIVRKGVRNPLYSGKDDIVVEHKKGIFGQYDLEGPAECNYFGLVAEMPYNEFAEVADVKYCPFCGRKLEHCDE